MQKIAITITKLLLSYIGILLSFGIGLISAFQQDGWGVAIAIPLLILCAHYLTHIMEEDTII